MFIKDSNNEKNKLKLFLITCAVLLVLAVTAWVIFIVPERYNTPIVLKGTVVTPDEIIEPGWVVVRNRVIQSVSSQRPNVADAIEIDTEGIIFPGLINLHDHVVWNVIPRWDPDDVFLNRYEWRLDSEENKEISAAVNGIRSDYFCQMNTYGEIRALVGGTTSILGTGNNLCIQGLVRNLDFYSGFYTFPIVQDNAHIRNYIDLPVEVGGIQKFLNDDASEAFFIHLAEGRGPAMRAEFDQLDDKGLLTDKTVIIHGIALDSDQFQRMSEQNASLIWSPRSNLELYGQTANILSALDSGVMIAIAPDWAITGSSNILDELHVAAEWNSSYLENHLSDKQLVEMVTKNPAGIAGISEEVGMIREGMYADLLVISGDTSHPYHALIEADPGSIQLVLVDGIPTYGALSLMEQFWEPSEFSQFKILGTTKAVMLPNFSDIVAELQQALSAYSFVLAPISEAVDAGLPGTVVQDETATEPPATADEIDWKDALFFFGENKTICGIVVDTHFAESSEEKLTYLYLGEPYPDIDRFNVLITESARETIPSNSEDYLGKTACISGTIESYQGVAQIAVNDPAQITTK